MITKDPDRAFVGLKSSDDTSKKCCFTTTTRTQESVSEKMMMHVMMDDKEKRFVIYKVVIELLCNTFSENVILCILENNLHGSFRDIEVDLREDWFGILASSIRQLYLVDLNCTSLLEMLCRRNGVIIGVIRLMLLLFEGEALIEVSRFVCGI